MLHAPSLPICTMVIVCIYYGYLTWRCDEPPRFALPRTADILLHNVFYKRAERPSRLCISAKTLFEPLS